MRSCGGRHLSHRCHVRGHNVPQFPGGRLPHLTSPSQPSPLLPSCAGQHSDLPGLLGICLLPLKS